MQKHTVVVDVGERPLPFVRKVLEEMETLHEGRLLSSAEALSLLARVRVAADLLSRACESLEQKFEAAGFELGDESGWYKDGKRVAAPHPRCHVEARQKGDG